jgi:hypothetical protein
MPGSFGTTPLADGADVTTASSANSGIFANNTATTPAPNGTPGGNGVFGLSTVPNASGVCGANNNGGTGVSGISNTGAGMFATTAGNANQGIFASNTATTPCPAGTPGGNGIFGLTTVPNASGVFGANNCPTGGTGVSGNCDNGNGMLATTKSSANSGIFAVNNATVAPPAGVVGGCGVFGLTLAPTASGVFGANNCPTGGTGVSGNCDNGNGMLATSKSSANSGIFAVNNATVAPPAGVVGGCGVFGLTLAPTASGVFGANNCPTGGTGVSGNCDNGTGVLATSKSSSNSALFAVNNATVAPPAGVVGGNGVFGLTMAPNGSGVFGANNSPSGGIGVTAICDTGTGIYARGSTNAGSFQGNVSVTGNISVTGDILLTNADCAEEFDVANADEIEPGDLVVLDQDGALGHSRQPYDKRVAGVISGAGEYKPGIVLDRREGPHRRMPIALVGKVYCKVDADFSPIGIGDLLTSSSTPGHAMKVTDSLHAPGAVIGKALRPLQRGRSLIPVLVALQ